jgi:hypothetical protein
MRSWTTRWALVSLLAIAVSAGSASWASAQLFGGDDREETRPSQRQQERPGLTERLRQWFEAEREAWQQRPREQARLQAQRERRAAIGILYAGYLAGYLDGYHDAIDDHLSLLVDNQEPRGGPPARMIPQRPGLSPRDREQFRRSVQQRIRSQIQPPAGTATPTLTGEILRTKRVERKSTGQEHLVALVETDQGRRRIVDLGPSENLNDLDLGRGDRISVQGKASRATGNVPIVLAQRLKAGDQHITIQRNPPQQKNAPSPPAKKEPQQK